jgi:hypothetical protein
MNKKLLLLIAFALLAVCQVRAQDKIITIQGDTILCRILSISQTHIHYEQRNGQVVVGKFIPIERVSEYLRSAEAVAYRDLPRNTVEILDKKPTSHKIWRAGLQFGGAYLLESTTEDETAMQQLGYTEKQASDYAKQYRNGIQFSADLHVMFDESMGFGMKYSFFHTSARTEEIFLRGSGFYDENNHYYDIPTFYTFSASEDMYVNYVGLSIVLQQRFGHKQRFLLSGQASFGGAFFRTESRTNLTGGNVLGTKTIPAATLDLSVDYYVLPWLSVGAEVGLFAGKAKDIKISPASLNIEAEEVSLWRLDYSISTKFHFYYCKS